MLAEILKDEDVSEEIIRSIQSHASEYSGVSPASLMDFALLSCDDLTGLIVAVALVHSGNIAAVTVESVLKKFKSNSFAASVNRDKILKCESNLGLSLEEFIGLVLDAMQEEAGLLGL